MFNKKDALTSLNQYFEKYHQVCSKHSGWSFAEQIGIADHAEAMFALLVEFKLVSNRAEFNKLRNSSVMWRLPSRPRLSVDTEINNFPTVVEKELPIPSIYKRAIAAIVSVLLRLTRTKLPVSAQEEKVVLDNADLARQKQRTATVFCRSHAWQHAYAEQDSVLKQYRMQDDCSPVDQVIKSVQQSYLDASSRQRLTTGSQERDWYTPNTQRTAFTVNDGDTFVCWTHGDMRSMNPLYTNKDEVQQLTTRNMKQLLRNSTGIDLSQKADQIKTEVEQFCTAVDLNGNPIQLQPMCVLIDLQAEVDHSEFQPFLVGDLKQEHENLVARAKAIDHVNAEIQQHSGVPSFFTGFNLPMAFHGRMYLSHHEKLKQPLAEHMRSVLENQKRLLGLAGSPLTNKQAALKQAYQGFCDQVDAYIQHPTKESLERIERAASVLRDRIVNDDWLALDASNESSDDQKKRLYRVVSSLCCVNDTMRHWHAYVQHNNPSVNVFTKRFIQPEDVINLSASLLNSAALLKVASVSEIKCKSGKDRTGVGLQNSQVCFGYWSNPDNFAETQGYPNTTASYNCDREPFLSQYKALLSSGAWSTAVAQDCHCPALKSLTLPSLLRKAGFKAALSKKQCARLGQPLLDYHQKQSSYNRDFHKKIYKGKTGKKTKQAVEAFFQEAAPQAQLPSKAKRAYDTAATALFESFNFTHKQRGSLFVEINYKEI